MIARVCIAAVVLLGSYGAAESFRDRGMPTELARPQLKLDELPKVFGSWTGKDVPLDPLIFRAIGAEMAISREYRDKHSMIDLHSDVFTNYGVRTLHPPELCYTGSGFAVANGQTVQIEAGGNGEHPAQLLTLEREGQKIYCLYWYQIGDATFWNSDEQRRQVRSVRGRTTWPPMIKVMLQTSANSPEEAARRLKTMAALVYDWTKRYH